MLKAISNLMGAHAESYSSKSDAMLQVLLNNIELRARFLKSISDHSREQIFDDILSCVENTRSGPNGEIAAWTAARALESRISLVEPLGRLPALLRLRLDEAAVEQAVALPRLREAVAVQEARAWDKQSPPEVRLEEENNMRALILELEHQIDWARQKKFYSRPFQKTATRRIIWAALAAFAAFAAPYVIMWVSELLGSKPPVAFLSGLPMYTALTAGLFGAYFSRLQFIQSYRAMLSIGGLKIASEPASIFLRGCVGMCGGLVVYFFLRSGLIAGEIFPDFKEINLLYSVAAFTEDPSPESDQIRFILPSPGLALLAVWCFVAGFSERLVPTIISSTESQLTAAARGSQK